MNKRTFALIAAIPLTAAALAACGSTSSTNPAASMPNTGQSTNNAMMQEQLNRAKTYIDKERQQSSREALGADLQIAGPVKL